MTLPIPPRPRTLAPRVLALLLAVAIPTRAAEGAPTPASAAAPASGSIEERFQRALFDEEGRRDYPAAIRGYEGVLLGLEEQRRLAATAVFRLGECYRKLGRTNDAVAQFQRLLREFSTEDTLATLSLQNLAALGATLPNTRTVTGLMSDPQWSGNPQFLGGPGTTPPSSPADPAPATSEEAEEIRRIQSVVAHSPDLINAPKNGLTPLALASQKGQLAVVRYLLDHGADPASPASQEGTALHYAAASGHKAIVEVLLARGAPVNAAASDGTTALHLAAQSGFRALVEVLLTHKADPNALGYLKQPAPRTPLGAALLGGHLAVARLLLDKGAQPDRGAPEYAPALAYAAGPDAVALLLEFHANPNADGGRRLLAAVVNNDLRSATLLLEAGANPNQIAEERGPSPRPATRSPATSGDASRFTTQGRTPILSALIAGRREMAELLLKHGADINLPGGDVLSPIHWAARSAGTNDLAWVLDRGGDPNLRVAKVTPLEWADVGNLRRRPPGEEAPRPEVQAWQRAKLLLHRGANPNLPFSNGSTFLQAAARSGDATVFAALEGRVTNVNASVATGLPPLILAAASGNEEAVRWLLQAGATVDAVDADDTTALFHAVLRRDTGIVRLLLEAGADPNRSSPVIGNTPLSYLQNGIAPTGARGDGTFDLRRHGNVAPADRPIYQDLLALLTAHAGTNAPALPPAPPSPQPRNQVAFFGAYQGTLELGPGRPLTVIDAILAQKIPTTANLRRVRVHHHPATLGEGEPATIDLDVTELLRSNDRSKDLPLRAGDRIEIPERVF